MGVLVNKKVKQLFIQISLVVLFFGLALLWISQLQTLNRVFYIFICVFFLGIVILRLFYRYFQEQYKIMESAILQITEYKLGKSDARIECDDEGELYRLFHEVNSLVAILNAHIENEKHQKVFLKNTLSDISHQLKTPLTALGIYNAIIQGEVEKTSDIYLFTKLSEQELDRIDILVQNLLKITKLDAGMIILERTLENVYNMMQNVKKQFLFLAEQENKDIKLHGEHDILVVCDRNWLIEAISNLVKNALDHTKDGDVILIEWRELPSAIQIVIKDNGIGIHPEDMPHIFKRFYRSRFSKDTNGIGLGLPLAKAIIEAHNGMIEVDSELNVGTSFVITFLIPTKL